MDYLIIWSRFYFRVKETFHIAVCAADIVRLRKPRFIELALFMILFNVNSANVFVTLVLKKEPLPFWGAALSSV